MSKPEAAASRPPEPSHRVLTSRGETDHDLAYGDLIVLFCPSRCGYIQSTGIIDSNIYLEVLDTPLEIPIKLRNCVFELCPKQSVRHRTGKTPMRSTTADRLSAPRQSTTISANSKEKRLHDLETKLAQGDPLIYGSVLQLRHVESGQWLTLSQRRAVLEKSHTRIELVEDSSDGCWLSVVPASKLKSEGDHVSHRDMVLLQSVRFPNRWLNVSAQVRHIHA
jgi:hypothetical protein